jgi:hypothetical protein
VIEMSDNSLSLMIGGEEKAVALSVMGKLYVFTPAQNAFLLALQKMRNIHAAAVSVSKAEEWGRAFIASRKFRDYVNDKLKEYSVKCGLTPEYLVHWGKEAMEGRKEWYEGTCLACGYGNRYNTYEYAENQNDDLEAKLTCKRCYSPTEVTYKEEPFKPTREQLEAYKELKATIIPKVERTHHTFENTQIVFQSEGETQS